MKRFFFFDVEFIAVGNVLIIGNNPGEKMHGGLKISFFANEGRVCRNKANNQISRLKTYKERQSPTFFYLAKNRTEFSSIFFFKSGYMFRYIPAQKLRKLALMSDSKTGAEQVHWNLNDLLPSHQVEKINEVISALLAHAAEFAEVYKGKIAGLKPPEFAEMMKKYEKLLDEAGKVESFAYLQWSTNTTDAAYGKLLQQANELSSEMQQLLVFMDVEWLGLSPEKASAFIEDENLASYRHYLEASLRYKPHVLDEKQEQVLAAKAVTGRDAWIRFFDETLGKATFEWDGELLAEQQVLSKLHEGNRETRKKAHASLTKTFRSLSHPLTFVFNTLLSDKHTNDKLRRHPHWLNSRNLANKIDEETVDALVSSVQAKYPTVQRYYDLKRRLLGLEVMHDYDRYAPLLENETIIPWPEAKKMVIDAYSAFNPEMGKITALFFEKNWIDAAITPGKRGGAYSASTVPSAHPYVFMNYDGKIRDVQTLAHELGHGVHQYLSARQGVLQASTPLTTSETASVFGEMLVFQNLMQKLSDPKEKLAMLLGKIDDTIATVFRQISMNRFEHAIHTARREEGELTTERFSELWFETQKALYGDSIQLTEEYKLWWCYIPHFLHTPGYVYAYSFGELLVMALYQKYVEQPEGFSEKYMDLLRAGGSDWPHNLVSKLDLDITQHTFWNSGLDVFERMVSQAETLAHNIE